MQEVIAKAISQGIAKGFQQRGHRRPRLAPQSSPVQDEVQVQRPSSPHSSLANEGTTSGRVDLDEQELSADEGLVMEAPSFPGLFKPAMFKFILFKAKASTQVSVTTGPDPGTKAAQDLSEGLFAEQVPIQEIVPSPHVSGHSPETVDTTGRPGNSQQH